MGTQKNRLNEMVLLSTQNICKKIWVRKYLLFYAENFCLSKPMYIEILHPKHLQKIWVRKYLLFYAEIFVYLNLCKLLIFQISRRYLQGGPDWWTLSYLNLCILLIFQISRRYFQGGPDWWTLSSQ